MYITSSSICYISNKSTFEKKVCFKSKLKLQLLITLKIGVQVESSTINCRIVLCSCSNKFLKKQLG